MKIEKGQAGYIKAQKNKLMAQSFISFGIVIAIFLLGYFQTGTRLNWLTFIAVLGCLPAAKMLVGLIAIMPYKTIEPAKAAEIAGKAPLLTMACDMVITSRDKIMPVDAVVISGNTVCGYASSSKNNRYAHLPHADSGVSRADSSCGRPGSGSQCAQCIDRETTGSGSG